MTKRARILILTRNEAALTPLSEELERLGWPGRTERGLFAGLASISESPADAVIIDASAAGSEIVSWPRRLRAAALPRRLKVIGLAGPALEPHIQQEFDSVVASPPDAAALGLRLEGLARLAVAEEELDLRGDTFAERGRRLDAPETDTSPVRVLFVGEPAPQFLALSNALARLGARVVGAFTSYTAFDYLHERPFDCVALWAGEHPQEALSIVAGMRRNTRLYHVPALLYERKRPGPTAAEAFRKGVTEVVPASVSQDEAAARVLELARGYRALSLVRRALETARGSGLMDAGSGLFTPDLFAAHLVRLADAASARCRPLSVCVLKVADRPHIAVARAGGWLERAIPKIGAMIGRLVRAEDTAARLGPDTFALALPATNGLAAQVAAERVAAVIACTAFDCGPGRAPFVAEFEIGVAEVSAPTTAANALEIAAAEASRRQAAG